jgi:YjbE family integral membrane protein
LDLGILGQIHFTWEFFLGFVSIIFIDLILAGDNAVVIALAVRTLPQSQRMKGIIFGAGAAVVLRVVLTFFAAQLLLIQYVKCLGGILILWIAVKLFVEGAPEEKVKKEAKQFWQAIWIIVIADITMSTDNVLAVAAASGGNLFLLIFGLGLSIPFVVFTSTLLSRLMDRYPIIIYIGAAILGRVGGEMIMTDPFIVQAFQPSEAFQYSVEAFFTIGVIVAGKIWIKMKTSGQGKTGPAMSACDTTGIEKNNDA